MSLSTSTLTAAVAGLSVAGVTILDVSFIPIQVAARDCPVMFPMPGEFINGSHGSPEAEITFGTPTTRYWHVYRTLKYIYLDSIVGSTRGINEIYAAAAGRMDLIWTALTTLNTATVDVTNISHDKLGTVQDASNNTFYGAIWTIELRERINQ